MRVLEKSGKYYPIEIEANINALNEYENSCLLDIGDINEEKRWSTLIRLNKIKQILK